MNIQEDKVVAAGEWLYDGIVPCKVVVVQKDMWPGSGDHEDPPEIAEDRNVTCFAVWYESPGTMEFKTGGGYYATIDEAITAIEGKLSSSVKWHKKL